MLYKITQDTLYFYSNQGDYNFMNPVSLIPFTELYNEQPITYETVQQYILRHKLLRYNPQNKKLHRLIMSTHNPVLYTVYERKIQNTNDEEWLTLVPDLLKHAFQLQLDQHPNNKKRLYRTGTKQLFYAHDKDRFLGIGFGVKVAWTTNPIYFGQNILGHIWTQLRNELNTEEYVNLPLSKRETKTVEKQQRMIDRTNNLIQDMTGLSETTHCCTTNTSETNNEVKEESIES
jgi:ribA/ribD-fused uncharacterized protein